MLKHHAQIAREEGVSVLMLGAELGGRITAASAMNSNCARWQQLISNVRTQAANVTSIPAGSPATLKLTYSPTIAGFWNNIDANEAPYVCFWDQMDHIGLNAYHHMNFRGVSSSATPANKIASGWNSYKRIFNPENVNSDIYDDLRIDVNYANAPTANDYSYGFSFGMPISGFSAFDLQRTDADSYQIRYNTNKYSTKWYADYVIDAINERFKTTLQARGVYPLKAILTEVGAPSSYNVQGYWGSVAPGSEWASSWITYVDEQARAWDGYLRAFRADPRIIGISMWGVAPYHDRTWQNTTGANDWLADYDFNAKVNASNQRVSEEQICKWFKRGYGTSTTCYTN